METDMKRVMSRPRISDETSFNKLKNIKSNLLWYISVSLLVVIAVCTAAIFSYAFAHYASKNEPLPSLSDECRHAQPANIYQHCAYHRNKYPISCTEAKCDTVRLNWDSANRSFEIGKPDVETISVIPDRTPCADGRWCQRKECVKTSNDLVKTYSAEPAINGRWKNHCNDPQCIAIDRRKNDKLLYRSKHCHASMCYQRHGHHPFRVGFCSVVNFLLAIPNRSWFMAHCTLRKHAPTHNCTLGVDLDSLSDGHVNSPDNNHGYINGCPLLPNTCTYLPGKDSSTCRTVNPDMRTAEPCDFFSSSGFCWYELCLPNDPSNYCS